MGDSPEELVERLRRRVRDLERALRAQEDLLSVAAHDLKTPATGLLLQAELLERQAERLPDRPVERERIRVVVAQAQRVTDLLDRCRPSLVLLDMRLPHRSGWEVAPGLAARWRDVPVVVMAAAGEAERWAAELGAAGCLSKPFNRQALLATVERLWDRGAPPPPGGGPAGGR